jgi:hypothetical protein
MIKETKSWLCGTTNSILTQQREVDLLVHVRFVSFCLLSSAVSLRSRRRL